MRRPPTLLIRVQLEELPVSVVLATSAEDEARLRSWLATPLVRQRLLVAIEDLLDDLGLGRVS